MHYLRQSPPEVVVILDADCLVSADTIKTLARQALHSGRQVQALNLTDRLPPTASGQVLAILANRFTNLIRPLGLLRVGLPCRLMGTGLAMPWPLLEMVPFVGDNLVEDMQWGIDLALAGYWPLFCPEARVTSALPLQNRAFVSQRIRWEHGHLRTIIAQVPRLLARSLLCRDFRLFCLAWDLSIPPLALLAVLWSATIILSLAATSAGVSWWPAAILSVGGIITTLAFSGAWFVHCRRQIPFSALLAMPLYILRKLPIYISFSCDPKVPGYAPNATIPLAVIQRGNQMSTRHDVQPDPSQEAQELQFSILGVKILNVTKHRAIELLEKLIRNRDEKTRSIFFVNAHTLNLAAGDPQYRAILNLADFAFGDGTGVRWAAKLQGVRLADNLVGTDFTPLLLQSTANRGYSYFMLGSDEQTIVTAARVRSENVSRLDPFRIPSRIPEDPEYDIVGDRKNKYGQARCAVGRHGQPAPGGAGFARIKRALQVPVCMGIGGLFDYWAGNVSRAPQWLRSLGHEWIWRLYQQPRDKMYRYLVGNPLFLARIIRERLSKRKTAEFDR